MQNWTEKVQKRKKNEIPMWMKKVTSTRPQTRTHHEQCVLLCVFFCVCSAVVCVCVRKRKAQLSMPQLNLLSKRSSVSEENTARRQKRVKSPLHLRTGYTPLSSILRFSLCFLLFPRLSFSLLFFFLFPCHFFSYLCRGSRESSSRRPW